MNNAYIKKLKSRCTRRGLDLVNNYYDGTVSIGGQRLDTVRECEVYLTFYVPYTWSHARFSLCVGSILGFFCLFPFVLTVDWIVSLIRGLSPVFLNNPINAFLFCFCVGVLLVVIDFFVSLYSDYYYPGEPTF